MSQRICGLSIRWESKDSYINAVLQAAVHVVRPTGQRAAEVDAELFSAREQNRNRQFLHFILEDRFAVWRLSPLS